MRIGNKQITPATLGRMTAGLALAAALTAPSTAFADEVRLWVDPGHGGKDPGAVSGGLSEKDSNIEISRMIVESAKRQGWKVGTSRGDDKFVSLNARPKRANAFKADALVSIHSNSAGSKPTGHMTIHRGGASKRLGDNVMKELAPLTKYEDIGNRSDSRGLAVLRGAKVPAVIVELLSVSNAQERAQLKSPAAQREMAEAVIRGVARNEGVKYVPPKAAPAKAQPKAAPAAAKPAAKAPAAAKPAAGKPAPEAKPTPATTKQATAAKPAVKKAPAEAKTAKADTFGFKALWDMLFG